MLTLDIFKGSAFSLMSLTTLVNEQPFVPGQIGRMGICSEEGVTTTTIAIENYKGTLTLVPDTPRTAPANKNTRDSRALRLFRALHLPIEDSVTADEIQNVRPLPGQGEVQLAQQLVTRKMQRMTNSLDATVEYGRIGAIKGIIYDADGSTPIYNLFSEFGIAAQTEDYQLGTSSESMIVHGNTVKNKIEDALGDAPYTKIVAVCGKTWFNRFVSHPSVVAAYAYFEANGQRMNPNRDDMRYEGFEHGGITYVQYRGKVSGVPYVADNEAYAFPVGVPDLFKTFFVPANYMETANTTGLPRYAKMGIDPSGYNKFVPFEVQTNPITINTRPATGVKLTTGN